MSNPATRPRLRLLGRFGLELSSEEVELCLNAQRLVAFLYLRGRSSRTVAAGTLWPEVAEERARGSLRTTLWRFPRGDLAVIDCSGECLSLCCAVSVDVRKLEETALHVVNSGGVLDPPPLELLTRGDLLPGWDEEWVLFERERIRQLRLHALDTLAEGLARQGRHALALEAALASVRIEPLRESAHRAVISAHLAENNVGEAIRHYRMFVRLLRDQLSVEPSPEFIAACSHHRTGSSATQHGS
ncbi:SARP family transcriptional regulator [Streptomyces sp. CB00316]|uniref:AfsR/SARP family transcriptional regulator n=1 Tax=Streptomyces sp. CB00316 TaxID=1703932 RepID=UPI00093AE568|nr:BTAD domain-containing putative transcriptional regulator [Streptomyces sp. CB00316]OKJ10630.1 SARP family transcriptional regulator [Streptomyces sp. CB00316]